MQAVFRRYIKQLSRMLNLFNKYLKEKRMGKHKNNSYFILFGYFILMHHSTMTLQKYTYLILHQRKFITISWNIEVIFLIKLKLSYMICIYVYVEFYQLFKSMYSHIIYYYKFSHVAC